MAAIYLDCFSGISGNMLLGAFLDAGMPVEYLKKELGKLSLSGYKLEVKRVSKQGISAYHVDVATTKWFQPSRNLNDIIKIIEKSDFSVTVKEGAIRVFTRLGEAEAKVHGVGIEKVHFHEVGAVDAIVDITGAMIGMEYFQIDTVYVSPLHVGSGFVKCSHGRMPIPTPATAELLKGVPFYSTGVVGELVTPTGAAIVTTLGSSFGAMPTGFRSEKVAYGAGTMDLDIANVLRLYLGSVESGVTESSAIKETGQPDVAAMEQNPDNKQPRCAVMNSDNMKQVLQAFRDDQMTLEQAVEQLQVFSYEEMGFAKIDHHRAVRQGFPEVVFCQGKTVAQVGEIMKRLADKAPNVLGTRATAEMYAAVKEQVPEAVYHEAAGLIAIERQKAQPDPDRYILVMSAGTSDIPIAEEAALTAEIMGHTVKRVYDVGVAGIHRLFAQYDIIRHANVCVVVAGMEGALASVVGGLVNKPIIAVPTSIGYGANFHGLAALLSMLNSCAAGVAVVNIDNGFGAGRMASIINGMR